MKKSQIKKNVDSSQPSCSNYFLRIVDQQQIILENLKLTAKETALSKNHNYLDTESRDSDNLKLIGNCVSEKIDKNQEFSVQNDPYEGNDLYEFNSKRIRTSQNKDLYPPNKQIRKFCEKWFDQFDFLEYSIKSDKAYCYQCRIFGKLVGNAEANFSIHGYNNWKHALRDFEKHQQTKTHQNATIDLKNRREQDAKKTSINQKINSLREITVAKNKAYMNEIIRTIFFLSKQNIPFRGHNEKIDSLNRGNFLELVQFNKINNSILNEEVNCSYLGPKYQNEIIELIGGAIKKEIVKEVKGRPFSIIIDETPDISMTEQVSFCIRYVNDLLEIKERFVGFQKTGELVYKIINNKNYLILTISI